MTIIDLIRERAAETPDQPALVSDDGANGSRVATYRELVERFEAHGARFRDAGLGSADRCGLVAPQGSEFVERSLGVLAAGGCLVPIADDHRGEVLEDFTRRARLHHLVEGEGDALRVRSLADPGGVDGEDDRAFRALDPAYLRFTSGTTSRRKGVILSHNAILERLDAANRALAIVPTDRVMWLLPMAHHYVVSILLYLRFGATILLPAGSLARPVLDFAVRERASVFYASPYHYRLLGKDPSDTRLDSVRLAVSTAEGLHRDVAARFAERFGFPVCQALGIIEVGLPVVNQAAGAEKPGALGRPLPDFDVWLRGEDGRPVEGATSPERTGEICIRGPGMLAAYMDPWIPAAEILRPDGFRTGDQGWFDADGDLYLAGRRTSRISMAGMKFFGEEVEEVLGAHPGVVESRVFGKAHAHLGEIPVAEFVATDPEEPPTRKDLTQHCKRALPGYKIPREFHAVSAIERTATGKLRRASDSPTGG